MLVSGRVTPLNGQPVNIGGSKEIQDSMHNPLEILGFWLDEGMTAFKKNMKPL